MPSMKSEREELAGLSDHLRSQAEKFDQLKKLLEDLEAGNYSEEVLKECPDVAAKLVEKEKLLYRLNIMKRAIAESSEQKKPDGSDEVTIKKATAKADVGSSEKASSSKQKQFAKKEKAQPKADIKYVQVEHYGDSVIGQLNQVFAGVVKRLYPSIDLPIAVKETAQSRFGDYQFEMSSLIAHRLSAGGDVKVSPEEIAKSVVENLPEIALIEKVEVARVFVNVFVSQDHICKRIVDIFSHGIPTPKVCKKKVVIDFSSPNIAKQMHVGHLRSTVIGESLARLMEYMGFEVLRLNHVGDWGTQFGMLIAHLQDRFPDYLTETPAVQDLQLFYKESKKRFDDDADFKARAYECVVKLQNHEKDIDKAWNQICDVSRKDFGKIYERLDISLQERGESFYQSRMLDVVVELERANVLREEDERKVFFPTGCNVPLTVVKRDGGFTYDTSDLAALKQRLFEEKGEWVLYVVDRGQSEHLETIFAAGKDLGWYDPNYKRVEHVQFGVVLGADKKKFKTRSGDTVRLTDLLDEGLSRATAKLVEKGRKEELTTEQFEAARESIAYGCVKYADLCHARTSDYAFSFDKMLEDRGNTAVYLLYAYARIRSIARSAQISRERIESYVTGLGDASLQLNDPAEIRLAKQILKFSDCLLDVLENLMPHKLCDYIYNLATTFHDFYKECKVIQKDAVTAEAVIQFNRLVLCEVTADVMLQSFRILGLRALEKM